MDVPGERKQKQVAVRICPIEGPGSLSKTERSRRALVLMAEYGVNTDRAFREWEADTLGTTFREQSERWLLQVQTRKRKPVKARTVANWRSYLGWINQRIGDVPVRDVNNKTARELIAAMSVEKSRRGGRFSPITQRAYLQVVKSVVASVVNEQGEPMFPRVWNHDFIDLPVVGPHRQPSLSANEIAGLFCKTEGQFRLLLALLAGSGLRIGEALALEVGDLKGSTISVSKSIWGSHIGPPKTAAGFREVDLADDLAALLHHHIGGRETGFIFQSGAGTPLNQRNALGRQLHPALKSIGRETFGFHSFRRYRVTHLRRQRVPEDLIRFWLGHANRSVTDNYCKLGEDVEYRRQVAQAAGVGFPLDTLVTGCDPISPETVAVTA